MEAKPNGCVDELNEMLKVVVVPEMSGIHEQCVYKVPPRIRQANPQAYTPQVISIGPFHSPYGSTSDNILHQMEDLKHKYLKGFLNRTKLSVDDLVSKFQEQENRIRSCYAWLFSFNSNDFLKIIIIDACFIIEHFLRFYEFQEWVEDDPILQKACLWYDIQQDLILLENQLPFFVLEDTYKLASLKLKYPSFLSIAMSYFQNFYLMPDINPQTIQHPKHFTDLFRTSLLPPYLYTDMPDEVEHVEVYSVSELSEAGLVFEVSESKCLLDLDFDDKGVLKMPLIHARHTTESYLANVLAFKECHISDLFKRYIGQYMIMLDVLIKTEKDVSILVDKEILVNWMRDANEVLTMVNNLCKNVSMPTLNSMHVCLKLNHFYRNCRYSIKKMSKASFLEEYFNTPWKATSSVAAVLLLSLTLIQTVCSILSL